MSISLNLYAWRLTSIGILSPGSSSCTLNSCIVSHRDCIEGTTIAEQDRIHQSILLLVRIGQFLHRFRKLTLSAVSAENSADNSGGLDGRTIWRHPRSCLLNTDWIELAQSTCSRLEIRQYPVAVWICGFAAFVFPASSWQSTCRVSPAFFRARRRSAGLMIKGR